MKVLVLAAFVLSAVCAFPANDIIESQKNQENLKVQAVPPTISDVELGDEEQVGNNNDRSKRWNYGGYYQPYQGGYYRYGGYGSPYGYGHYYSSPYGNYYGHSYGHHYGGYGGHYGGWGF